MLPPKTRVYLTVDVETSMGGAWRSPDRCPLPIDKLMFGKIGNTSYGLPLMIGELEKYGFGATFFTEMFFPYCLGAEQGQIVVDYLLNHRQDVQLHIHPVFRNYAQALKDGDPEAFPRYRALGDSLNAYDCEAQHALLSEGLQLFRSYVGEKAVAFRAGGFRADRRTLAALGKLGIPIDSSYNPSVAASFTNDVLQPNVVQRIEGVVEMPLTTALTGYHGGWGWKPMAISSVTFAELKAVLQQAYRAGLGDVLLICHSFSTVKARDFLYSEFRPNRIVISRFRRLLQYLAGHDQMFEVCTIREAGSRLEQFTFNHSNPRLSLGVIKPLIRGGIQAVNRMYWT